MTKKLINKCIDLNRNLRNLREQRENNIQKSREITKRLKEITKTINSFQKTLEETLTKLE